MEQSESDELNKYLEMEGAVPEYLKSRIVSEIDLIKDTLQIVSLYGGMFFLSALKAVTSGSDSQSKDE